MTSTDLTGMTRDEAIAAARDLAEGLVSRAATRPRRSAAFPTRA